MKKLIVLSVCLTIIGCHQAFALNLLTDIEENTQWTLGQQASGGTAINLKTGSLSASALAGIAGYRMLSFWYGGTMVNPSDGSMTDTAKIGLNLGYLLKNFTNQPPALIKNLVIGPSFAMGLISAPRVGTFLFDCNYRFGSQN